jgi:beta-phosphoglucomutase-like phosphatase (HAD superfamily)
LYAAQQLRSAPENCVVIEDSPHGIVAARKAGMRCIAMTTTYDCEKLQNADLVVNSYLEIDLEAVDKHTMRHASSSRLQEASMKSSTLLAANDPDKL